MKNNLVQVWHPDANDKRFFNHRDVNELLSEIEIAVKAVAGFVWGPPMIILLFGTHIYLSIQLRFIQIRNITISD